MIACLLILSLVLLWALPAAAADPPLALEDGACRVEFGPSGALTHLLNKPLADDCLKEARPAPPCRLFTDFRREYELGDDPAALGRELPLRLTSVSRRGGLVLQYEADDLTARLAVRRAGEGVTDWSLEVRNTGAAPRAVMASFPYWPGVTPGVGPRLATHHSQAGMVVPAWSQRGGVVGNGGQVSMQWHAVWAAGGPAVGMIMMDPAATAKMLVLEEPAVEVRHFPERTLEPGETWRLPPARLIVYRGDWRPAALAYREWFSHALKLAEPPAWFRQSDGCEGRHFKKGAPADYGGQFALDSFEELPAAHLRVPYDNMEYAFFSRGSMLYGKHTDGDNVVREDLGGAAAMRRGIEGVHRLGLHATLYIEGYIVHNESDLAKSGRAERWSVMHRDGTITGGYTSEGFYHMCPGCAEWQDHLASTVSRLLRETGADGVRLDSLGFYFLPCYNPAHRHETPFGYNEWMKQLLSKVRRAALAVNPQALLTTEAPVDWWGQWFHGALTQAYPRDLPPMRLAVAPYRPYAYAQSGVVWGAVSGLAGGRSCWEADLAPIEANWLCARRPVHEALVWGEVEADPGSSDAGVVARCFRGKGYRAVVAVRPASGEAAWPAYTGLAEGHRGYDLTLAGLAGQVHEAVACDVETLTWRRLPVERRGEDLVVHLRSSFALVVLREEEGPAVVDIGEPAAVKPGERITLRVQAVTGQAGEVEVRAPGLKVRPAKVSVPGEVTVSVPAGAAPGLYGVEVRGRGVLGGKRWVRVGG